MKRVLFYIHNGWVFGKIHNELIKVLYPDLHCDIVCWSQTYTDQSLKLLNAKYDLFVSTPATCFFLHKTYGIPYEKLVGIVHQDWDIFDPIESKKATAADFAKLRGYAVICPLLTNISFSYGVGRVPVVLPVGVMRSLYAREPATGIRRLGYFGSMERKDRGIDIKRGYLAQRVAQEAGLELVSCSDLHFLATDKLYSLVDLTIFCSLIEGNPYVALESFAAGVPVLGTATGIFPALAGTGAGAVLPFDEERFVPEAVEVIKALHEDFSLYQKMHQAALMVGETRDWSRIAPLWRDYLLECAA